MDALEFSPRTETELHTLTLDVLKSSEIKDFFQNPNQVRSSIVLRLSIDIDKQVPTVRDLEGIIEMMLNATLNYS